MVSNESSSQYILAESAEQGLNSRGYSLIVPKIFHADSMKNNLGLTRQVEANRLTGLAHLNDEIRSKTIDELTSAITKGKPFAYLHVDADYLKTANDKFGRALGDLCIKWNAAHTLQIVEKCIPKNVKAKIVVYTPAHAADEVVVWIFGEEQQQIDTIVKQFEDIDIAEKFDDPDYTFSSSYGFVTSENQLISTNVAEAKSFLDAGSEHRPYDLFQNIAVMADDQAHFYKAVKEILDIPNTRRLFEMNPTDFKGVIRKQFAQKRVGGRLLDIVLSIAMLKASESDTKHLSSILKGTVEGREELSRREVQMQRLFKDGLLALEDAFTERFHA